MAKGDRLKLELRRSFRPFLLVMILFAAGAAVFGIIFKNLTFERPWKDYTTVKAEFDDVKGIFPGGHQVRIHGVKVGVVSKADLDHGRAILTLKIEKKYGKIYKNARLRIRPVTPLEDLYVNFTSRGTPDAGQVDSKTIIGADQTETPVDVSRVLDTFNADTRQRLTILLSEMGKGLDDGGVKLRATFAELAPFLQVAQQATAVLHHRQVAMRRIITNFGELSAALAKRDRDLHKFVDSGNATLGELAQEDQPFGDTITQIAQLLPVMKTSFASLRGLSGELDPTLDQLKPVTQNLEKGLKGLQQFGTDATPALRALRPAVTDLRTMARQLNPTAKTLNTTFAKLSPQAPQLERVVREFPPCMGVISDFFANTLSVFKIGDANGAFPRADEVVDADTGVTNSNYTPAGLDTRPAPFCTDQTAAQVAKAGR